MRVPDLVEVDLSPLGEALLLWLEGEEEEMDEVLDDREWVPSVSAE